MAQAAQGEEQQIDSELQRAAERYGLFWTVILYLSIGLSLFVLWQQNPGLFQGPGILIPTTFIIAFCVIYHRYYVNWWAREEHWPMPLRRALLYLCVQTALAVVLLNYSISFLGLIFALMGQTCSVLQPRQWIVPVFILMGLLGAPFGFYDELAQGDWIGLFSFLFNAAIWLGIFLFSAILFENHFRMRRLVEELRQARAELEASAAQKEELAVLRERTRLAREMHDSLGHALVVVNVKLEAAQRLYAREAARGDAELEATRALVRDTMGELRQSLANLRAPSAIHDDLPAALRKLGQEVATRSGLAVQVQAVAGPPLPPATSEALWGVARESLTNVEKHAAAASASLHLERQNGSYVLRVVDDGSGIKGTDMARPGHFGIVGMRERVEQLGGSLQITRGSGGGTVVEARVPQGDREQNHFRQD
ncbi:MAG: sensor histidine kinase [Chloroflexaceae bacterium]|jgi:signal transduction histidine kinase|nr:sensor histidine kinase [Chloroflexaceae bacterium]